MAHFNQFMMTLISTIHVIYHQHRDYGYMVYLPYSIFAVALFFMIASIRSKQHPARFAGYLLSVLCVLMCVVLLY